MLVYNINLSHTTHNTALRQLMGVLVTYPIQRADAHKKTRTVLGVTSRCLPALLTQFQHECPG
jgi:hypothetical protein